MTGLNESSEISEETYNERKKMIRNSKSEKLKRDYDYNISSITDRYFDLFLCSLLPELFYGCYAYYFDACIDSWKADPELNNFRYMWNILMYVIPYTLWAFAAGFLVHFFSPQNELIFGGYQIFLLKRRMRRENKLREGNNDSH